MKIFLDRLFSLFEFGQGTWSSRLGPEKKKAIIIGTCAGSNEASMGFTIEAMRRVMTDLGVDVLIEEVYYGTRRVPVERNEKIRNEVREKVAKVLV